MDEFDFDDIDDTTNKKPAHKPNQKHSASKAYKPNNNNDDFFYLQINAKPTTQPLRKNNFEYSNIDSYLDDIDKKQPTKKLSQKNKQNESTLPRININKSPESKQQKPPKNRMDLSLQQLPEKRVMVQKEPKRTKKDSEDFDFAVDGAEPKQNSPKNGLKTSIMPQKQVKAEKKQIQAKISPQNISKTLEAVPSKSKSPQKTKIQQKKQQKIEQDDYAEEYQEQIQQLEKQAPAQKPVKPKEEKIQKASKQLPKKNPAKQTTQKQQKPQTQSKSQKKQDPITRYKDMVQKSFPQDLDQEKAKKFKPDALNRLNDKMRQMIKGFSSELTDLIDKNLILLLKPQNQIKQEIEGEPLDPVQAKVKLLEESKKNNQKMLEISEKQLENTAKMNEKMEQSVMTNVQVTQELEAFKKHIALITREISNLKNEVEKQGKKVVKMEQGNSNADEPGSKFKNSLEVRQKLANNKLQYEKHKKKLHQLNQKQHSLQQKISDAKYKRTQALQKASAQGITLCSKQQKKRYQQLKKKHDQLVLFESKFKSSIKSKESLIQHEMTDLEVLIDDYQKKYQLLQDEADASKDKIFGEIAKAKKNPKINSNTKDILAQLELFMSDDNPNHSEDHASLNYISQNIYKKEYQPKNHSKTITEQKQLQKVAYKNYIQEVAKINQQHKDKFTSQRRNSQINPFRKALTPGETSQAKQTRDKMNKTKDNNAEPDKQKQRVWKSSNTQTMIRNPLKKQIPKDRYLNTTEEQNPLSNKEIIKLIDKNKQKITLKEEDKSLKTEQSSPNKKPFTFRSSVKEKQISQRANQLVHIPNQMENIEKTIQNRRNQLLNKEPKQQAIPIKLKDKELQGIQMTLDLKPPANNTPFRNIKLKKDKEKQAQMIPSDSKFKLQPEQSIEKASGKSLTIPQKIPAPQVQEQQSLKPKRFNLRQKKQTSDNAGYMPSSISRQKQKQKQPQITIEKPKGKEPEPQFKPQQNKFRISDPVKKIQEEPFDPFKKFMANPAHQDKIYNNGPKLTANDDPSAINSKPRLNLFKKPAAETQQTEKKQILLKDVKKEGPVVIQESKFINPYAKQQPVKQQGIKIQRQGRVKKMNPPANSIKGGAKNIFGDVEDATSSNILSLGEPEIKPQQSYAPKSIHQDKEVNVNDLLGIKKKTVQVDKDLLIDLVGENKIGVKAKAGGKASDFFGDMDL